MQVRGGRFRAGKECGADLCGLCTELERGAHAARVDDAAGGNYRYAHAGGDKRLAAAILGISLRTLYRRLEDWGLH